VNYFFPLGSLLLRPHRCEISALFIYLFYFFSLFFFPPPQNGCYSLIASTSACFLERFLPVASRFVIVLIGNVSIPISHGVLFLLDSFD